MNNSHNHTKIYVPIGSIALGCWAFGGHGYGNVDDNNSIRTIQTAIDNGIVCMDTSPVYGLGHSETVLGQALQDMGSAAQDVSIITKFGFNWEQGGKPYTTCHPDSIIASVHDSLRRLKRDSIDTLLLHRYDEKTPFSEIFETLDGLKKSGEIKSYGLCNWEEYNNTLPQLPKGVSLLQSKFNIIQSQNLPLMKAAKNNGAKNIVYDVLARGLFSGKYNQSSTFGENDTRKDDFYFRPENFPSNIAITHKLQATAKKLGTTSTALAIAWSLAQQDVDIVLVGAKRPEQIIENIRASNISIPLEFMKEIGEYSNV